ncbi:MAG: ECF-type sigma factor [Planctomycetes bacterium]|nr:ECF-type sigma factor [Planctomycetota bacterium]
MSDPQRPGGLPPGEVTALLEAARGGDEAARRRLFDVVYAELKLLARRHLRRVGGTATLSNYELSNKVKVKEPIALRSCRTK